MNATTSTLEVGAECFVWCIVQVTLFAAVAAFIYWTSRRQLASRNVLLLAGSLAIVGVLTLACWSPWPKWRITAFSFIEKPRIDVPKTIEWGSPIIVSPPKWQLNRNRPVEPIEIPTARLVEAEAPEQAIHPDRPWWLIAVGAAWLLASIGLARFMVGVLFVRRYRRQSIRIENHELLREFNALRTELQIITSVELREAPSLGVAATIGWRRPIVLLPSVWREWTQDERRAVLAHELAHIAQRHFPLWFVSQLAIAPHFYHPLVHWLGRRLRLEQEIAADQLASQAFGNRRRYTDILAGLALGPMRPAGAVAGLGLSMSRPLLMRRIAMLREPSNDTRRPSHFVHGSGMVLLVLAALIVLGLRSSRGVAADDAPANPPVSAPPTAATQPTAASPATTATPTPVRAMPTMRVPTAPTYPDPPDAAIAPAEIVYWGFGPPTPYTASPPKDGRREITALLQVSSEPANLLGQTAGEQSWKVFSQTQAALLSSKFVLQSALSKPELAKLPLVAAQQDPVDWLHRSLGVGFIPDTELLSVAMTGAPNDADQMRKIVDGVVRTYMDEIVTAELKRRSTVRDMLARSVAKLNDEIRSKLEEHNDLAEELGIASLDRRDPETDLLIQEITEAMRAKTELVQKVAEAEAGLEIEKQKLADSPDASGYTLRELQIRIELFNQQAEKLAKTIQEITEKLTRKNQRSVELEVGTAELQQLREIANQMNLKLEMMDVDSAAPPRVRVIQWAM